MAPTLRKETGNHRKPPALLIEFVGFALLAALTGCSASTPPRGPRFWANTYAFGTLGERHFDVRRVCGERAAERLEVIPTPVTVLLGVVTLGIYTPHQVLIQCR